MKAVRRNKRFWLTLLLGGLVLALPLSASAEQFAIVVHKSLQVDQASTRELARLFLAESSSLGSHRLHPVNLAQSDEKYTFYEALTSMPRDRVAFHFVESELRGEGTWPREVLSELEVIKMILVSRRVVGWMSWEQYQGLAESVRKNLKLVSVDGHRPGEEGYPVSSR